MQKTAAHKGGDVSPFPVTSPSLWAVVATAASHDAEQIPAALRRLCEVYRNPIVEWLRRRGYGQDAEDLANSFVVFLLEKKRLENFSRGTARFRSFLLECLKRFLRDESRKKNAEKRGAGMEPIPLEDVDPGSAQEMAGYLDQEFAETVHGRTMSRLEVAYISKGHAERFAILQQFVLATDTGPSYAEIADRLNKKPNSVKKAVFDLPRSPRKLQSGFLGESSEKALPTVSQKFMIG